MNLSTRSMGLALGLLLLFLGATVAVQWWVAHETKQLQVAAVEEQRNHLFHALEVAGRPPEKWDAAFQRELGAILGGSIELTKIDATTPGLSRGFRGLSFTENIPSTPGWRAHAEFAMPALARAEILNQRTLAVIVVLALLLATVPLFLVLLGSRRSGPSESGSRVPWAMSRANAVGIEHFAKISNERTVALEQEQGARLRAEENLQVNRTLLTHSVEERARLGRDLHDNICQTLFAVCLTLESVQKKNTLAPELKLRVDQCMSELRRLNQEVRSYLQDLEPSRLNSQSFTDAVASMTASFALQEGVLIEHRLEEEAVALIPPDQIADIMNILREAVSNGLRHGQAHHITLLAGRNEGEIALAVQDDGAGFIGSGKNRGHGLANMQARARVLGGTLRVESTPGKGTRVLLSLPVASPV